MALICTTVTTWVTNEILVPIDTWVTQQSQNCRKLPWPINWLCSVVTFLVKVVVWIVQNIVVPIVEVICVIITWFIGAFLYLFLFWSPAASRWINRWFMTPTKIKFISKDPSLNQPGYYNYTFECNCKGGKKTIVVVAREDVEAAKLAIDECKLIC